MNDVIAILDSASADNVMSTLALAADTAASHHHLMTFDPAEPRLHDLHSHADQKHSTLSLRSGWVNNADRLAQVDVGHSGD